MANECLTLRSDCFRKEWEFKVTQYGTQTYYGNNNSDTEIYIQKLKPKDFVLKMFQSYNVVIYCKGHITSSMPNQSFIDSRNTTERYCWENNCSWTEIVSAKEALLPELLSNSIEISLEDVLQLYRESINWILSRRSVIHWWQARKRSKGSRLLREDQTELDYWKKFTQANFWFQELGFLSHSTPGWSYSATTRRSDLMLIIAWSNMRTRLVSF